MIIWVSLLLLSSSFFFFLLSSSSLPNMSSYDDDDAGLSATAVQSQLPAHRMRPPKDAMPDVVVLAQPSHVRRVARSLSWFFPFRVTGYVPEPGYLFLELVSEEEEAVIMEEHMPPGERRAGLSVPQDWLQAAPSYFATHFNATEQDQGQQEAMAKKLRRLAAALYRLARDPSYATVAPMLRFFPVLGEVPAGQGQSLLHGLDPEADRVRVQVSPRPCERDIGQTIPDEFPLTPRWEECTHMLSVVTFEGRWLWSLAKRDFYQPYFDMKILHDKHHSGEKVRGDYPAVLLAHADLWLGVWGKRKGRREGSESRARETDRQSRAHHGVSPFLLSRSLLCPTPLTWKPLIYLNSSLGSGARSRGLTTS
jgi:hypothetical protein